MKKSLLLFSTLVASTSAHADWTAWLDRDGASGAGDYESRADFPAGSVCASPAAIDARYSSAGSWIVISPNANTAPNYFRAFSPSIGLVCNNSDQPLHGKPSCSNYQVRFNCSARTDLSVKYRFLKQHDKQNDEYSKTSPAFKGRNMVSIARANPFARSNSKDCCNG